MTTKPKRRGPGRPRKDRELVQVIAYIEPEMNKRLEERRESLSKEAGHPLSMSAVLTRAISSFLEPPQVK